MSKLTCILLHTDLFACYSHQLLLGVQVACLAADSHLSQLVVSRAVGKLTEMLAIEGVKDQGSGDEEDKLVNLTYKLLHKHTVRNIYVP